MYATDPGLTVTSPHQERLLPVQRFPVAYVTESPSVGLCICLSPPEKINIYVVRKPLISLNPFEHRGGVDFLHKNVLQLQVLLL